MGWGGWFSAEGKTIITKKKKKRNVGTKLRQLKEEYVEIAKMLNETCLVCFSLVSLF